MPDNFLWRSWRRVIKLDPEKEILDEHLTGILQKKVDALIVGGTQGITAENTACLVDRIIRLGYKGSLVQEISESHAVIPGPDGYIIPVALNASDRKWVVGEHLDALKTYGDLIDWQRVLPVGYIVCNPESAVAEKTGALPVTSADVAAYAALAVNIFRLPAVYIEYSGAYGDPALVRTAAANAAGAKIFYGGAINSAPRLEEMSAAADTVVIGNALYDERDLKWL